MSGPIHSDWLFQAVRLSLLGGVFCVAQWGEAAFVRFDFNVSTAAAGSSVFVRLYDGISPNSVQNFLNYVTTNRYDGSFIHRSPRNFVVQGGGFLINDSIFEASGIVTDPPIPDEFGVSNRRGTLAFAKNSLGATSQWFFNVRDNTGLDLQDFTVIGRVVGNGMSLIDGINGLSLADFSEAEDVLGEDFDEVPVLDLDTVNGQNDITPADAVVITGVTLLDLPPGDYNGDGAVDTDDLAVWQATYGSTTIAEADGNGDGVVDAADYTIWRDAFVASSTAISVPEPAAAAMLLLSLLAVPRRR